MKPMQSFWGLLIIIIGLLFLGVNMGWWSGVVWSQLWALWPLILIILGLRALLTNTAAFIVAMIIALGLGGLLIATNYSSYPTMQHMQQDWSWHWNWGNPFSGEESTLNQTLQDDGTNQMTINLSGNYDIAVTGDDSNQVTVNLTGPKEIVDNLGFKKDADGSLALVETHSPSFNLEWFAQQVHPVKGTITLPKAIALKLDLGGLTTINSSNFQGKLETKASGASTLTFKDGLVTDPNFDLSGSGKVDLGACQGVATFDLSGAGKIATGDCTLSSLTVDVSGAGEVRVGGGTVTDAAIKTSGAAKVSIPKPTGKINQDNSGASNIELR